ncbi:MAG: Obg family GTPase CgtA [Solirubrobacteraceae bacterium]
MLYDRAKIEVNAGAGGNGSTSFRREAHVPKGGPDGGDGGRGGDVVLLCDESLRDLHQCKRRPHRRARRGGHGEGALRHGADGEDLVVEVPPGTQAVGQDGDLAGRSYDLVRHGQRAVIARGGAGGRGNKRFATPTRQAPRFAERGLPGEQGGLSLQLKLLADVGLVGLPNAGKSSLLSRLTRAAPKIGNYPFTTLEPVLGVLDDGERQLVIADIPGLIEGASDGAGLGHDFLSHVERCRLLVHVLDLAPELSGAETSAVARTRAAPDASAPTGAGGAETADVADAADAVDVPGAAGAADAADIAGAADAADAAMRANHETIERELAAYDERLASLPRVLALSKADLVERERVARAVSVWRERLGEDVPICATSSATGAGLVELRTLLFGASGAVGASGAGGAAPGGRVSSDLAEHIVYRPGREEGFSVRRVAAGTFAVDGRGIERLVARFDPENEEAMAHLEGRLRRIGVVAALEAEGFRAGDELEIGGVAFELDPELPG